jgi:hypothetical protein
LPCELGIPGSRWRNGAATGAAVGRGAALLEVLGGDIALGDDADDDDDDDVDPDADVVDRASAAPSPAEHPAAARPADSTQASAMPVRGNPPRP